MASSLGYGVRLGGELQFGYGVRLGNGFGRGGLGGLLRAEHVVHPQLIEDLERQIGV